MLPWLRRPKTIETPPKTSTEKSGCGTSTSSARPARVRQFSVSYQIGRFRKVSEAIIIQQVWDVLKSPRPPPFRKLHPHRQPDGQTTAISRLGKYGAGPDLHNQSNCKARNGHQQQHLFQSTFSDRDNSCSIQQPVHPLRQQYWSQLSKPMETSSTNPV